MPSREKPSVSGPVVPAKRPWLVVPGLSEPLLLLLSDPPLDDVIFGFVFPKEIMEFLFIY
jgi:hypothetical protein